MKFCKLFIVLEGCTIWSALVKYELLFYQGPFIISTNFNLHVHFYIQYHARFPTHTKSCMLFSVDRYPISLLTRGKKNMLSLITLLHAHALLQNRTQPTLHIPHSLQEIIIISINRRTIGVERKKDESNHQFICVHYLCNVRRRNECENQYS